MQFGSVWLEMDGIAEASGLVPPADELRPVEARAQLRQPAWAWGPLRRAAGDGERQHGDAGDDQVAFEEPPHGYHLSAWPGYCISLYIFEYIRIHNIYIWNYLEIS